MSQDDNTERMFAILETRAPALLADLDQMLAAGRDYAAKHPGSVMRDFLCSESGTEIVHDLAAKYNLSDSDFVTLAWAMCMAGPPNEFYQDRHLLLEAIRRFDSVEKALANPNIRNGCQWMALRWGRYLPGTYRSPISEQ